MTNHFNQRNQGQNQPAPDLYLPDQEGFFPPQEFPQNNRQIRQQEFHHESIGELMQTIRQRRQQRIADRQARREEQERPRVVQPQPWGPVQPQPFAPVQPQPWGPVQPQPWDRVQVQPQPWDRVPGQQQPWDRVPGQQQPWDRVQQQPFRQNGDLNIPLPSGFVRSNPRDVQPDYGEQRVTYQSGNARISYSRNNNWAPSEDGQNALRNILAQPPHHLTAREREDLLDAVPSPPFGMRGEVRVTSMSTAIVDQQPVLIMECNAGNRHYYGYFFNPRYEQPDPDNVRTGSIDSMWYEAPNMSFRQRQQEAVNAIHHAHLPRTDVARYTPPRQNSWSTTTQLDFDPLFD
jgi:hypothetical protein